VDEPRGTMVRALAEKQLRRGVHRSTRELEHSHPALHRYHERATKAVRVAQNRRRDPGERRALLVIESLIQDISYERPWCKQS